MEKKLASRPNSAPRPIQVDSPDAASGALFSASSSGSPAFATGATPPAPGALKSTHSEVSVSTNKAMASPRGRSRAGLRDSSEAVMVCSTPTYSHNANGIAWNTPARDSEPGSRPRLARRNAGSTPAEKVSRVPTATRPTTRVSQSASRAPRRCRKIATEKTMNFSSSGSSGTIDAA
ncbi:hypothetical protein D3C76_945910 [compost metagenome]